MRYGIGTTIENYPIIEALGLAHIELPGHIIQAMSPQEFEGVVATLSAGKATCCGFNAALPPHIVLCGEGYDLDAAKVYAQSLCERGAALGIATIGIGSPNSRKATPDDDQQVAWQQAEAFVTMFADVAKPYHITILYESLNHTECSFGLRLREGADLVRRANRDNLGLLFDIYHMAMEQEPLSELAYALPYVKHMHIAERVGDERRYPSMAMADFYQQVLDMVVASGYDGTICTEAFHGDILQGGRRTLDVLNHLLHKHTYAIGCVADDFTGASDAASFLMAQGLKTVLCNGLPTQDVGDCDAIVIALKSRTLPVAQAVAQSKEAFAWLTGHGAKQLYFKYCSTFDSTPDGNIGPVTDMLLETYHQPYTLLTPALPVNGRTVSDGLLYVGGVPLHQTHMKHHPLTPMWASRLADLMAPQGKYDALELNGAMLAQSKADILDIVAKFGETRKHFYIVPDYETPEQGEKIAQVFGHLPVLTGGSGLLAPLAKQHAQEHQIFAQTATLGQALLLSGSCSKITLAQVDTYIATGNPTFQLDPIALIHGTQTLEDIWTFIAQHPTKPVLVYSSDSPERVVEIQKLGKELVAETLERTTAQLAKRAVDAGYTRIIVAGGETSSAVVQALGYEAFEIGISIAPGVPVMTPLAQSNLRIALKSGNFGTPDFFSQALTMTGE